MYHKWCVLNMNDGTGKAAAYIRVSTERQKENKAHERQRERLENWAKSSNYKVDIYEDIAISGKSQDREEYQRMMSSINHYDAIVVRELSRFGRSVSQLTDDMEELERHDVDFISLEENIDTSTAQGELIFNLMASINQFKADLAKERAIREAQRRKEQGEHVGRPTKLSSDEADELKKMREEKNLSWSSLGKIFDVSRTTAKRTYERAQD